MDELGPSLFQFIKPLLAPGINTVGTRLKVLKLPPVKHGLVLLLGRRGEKIIPFHRQAISAIL